MDSWDRMTLFLATMLSSSAYVYGVPREGAFDWAMDLLLVVILMGLGFRQLYRAR